MCFLPPAGRFYLLPAGGRKHSTAQHSSQQLIAYSCFERGDAACKLDRERSRITVSSTNDVPLDWAVNGCMNGRTQYARRGSAWSRILVPDQDQTVSVLDYNPTSGEYIVTHYLLGNEEMTKLRALRREVEIKACSNDSEKVTILGDRQETIRQSLPVVPNERLVYSCKPA